MTLWAIQLTWHNVFCTWTLLALSDFVFYFLAVIERGIARGFDFRVVYEQILPSIVWSDEPITFA